MAGFADVFMETFGRRNVGKMCVSKSQSAALRRGRIVFNELLRNFADNNQKNLKTGKMTGNSNNEKLNI